MAIQYCDPSRHGNMVIHFYFNNQDNDITFSTVNTCQSAAVHFQRIWWINWIFVITCTLYWDWDIVTD